MTCWIVVPVKAPGEGKSRLAGVLNGAGRRELVARMLRHVVTVAGAVDGVDRVWLLGRSRHDLPESMPLLDDPGLGLNAALTSAMRDADAAGVGRLVLVSGDLPTVTVNDMRALVTAGTGVVLIAPDRHGEGTNALSLPLPQARAFRFHYGPGSLARHVAEAERLGLSSRVLDADGLAFDVDVPEDLMALDAATVRGV